MPCGAFLAGFCRFEDLKTFNAPALRHCGMDGQPFSMSCSYGVAVPGLGICQLVYALTAAGISSFASLNCSTMIDCNNAPHLKISQRGFPSSATDVGLRYLVSWIINGGAIYYLAVGLGFAPRTARLGFRARESLVDSPHHPDCFSIQSLLRCSAFHVCVSVLH